MKVIDITGQQFGKLTVIERAGKDKRGEITWRCRCDCGKTTEVRSSNLRRGDTKSCGCSQWAHEQSQNIEAHTTHGGAYTRLYNIWGRMKYRCNNPNCDAYQRYGGRGIKVCPEWENSFEAFYDWAMANGYRDDLSIDREDNDGNYEPGNCRWVTDETQSNNRSTSIYITFNGETKTVTEWAEQLNVRSSTIRGRLRRGWPVDRILTEGVHAKKNK